MQTIMYSLISLYITLVTNFHIHQNQIKHTLLHPTPRVSDSTGLGWDLRICSSNKFPRDATAGDHCSLVYTVPSLIRLPQQSQKYKADLLIPLLQSLPSAPLSISDFQKLSTIKYSFLKTRHKASDYLNQPLPTFQLSQL